MFEQLKTTWESIPLTPADLAAARERLRPHVMHTSLLFHDVFSRETGADVFLKLENLQHTGSFKVRGSANKLSKLIAAGEKPAGVIAVSAGNHAQGVARAALAAGLKAVVVMPAGASLTKVRACQDMGAEVVLAGDSVESATVEAKRIQAERGYAFLHPYDDWDVIAGQSTVGQEILADLPDVTTIVTPVGGGGLLSGVALAAKFARPDIRLIGVQTDAVSPYRNFLKTGTFDAVPPGASTIADGIKVKRPGAACAAVIRQYVDEIVTVDEDAIAETIVTLLERTRTIGEGAGVVALAALLKGKFRLKHNERVAVVISGGNVDMPLIGRSIDFGLVSSGRLLAVAIRVTDTPGQLAKLLDEVALLGMNVREVEHRRGELHIPVGQTEVVMQVETKDWQHQDALFQWLADQGYKARRLTDG